VPAPENVKRYFQFLIHSAFAQLAVDIDQNLQRHRAVSLRQHGFLVPTVIFIRITNCHSSRFRTHRTKCNNSSFRIRFRYENSSDGSDVLRHR